jgi:putative membrane protein insertion efficiency factor
MKKAILFVLRQYKRYISPLLGNNCRFYPTCSVYAYQAIEKYGLTKGIFLGIKRLLKCHPFHAGGVDPVP